MFCCSEGISFRVADRAGQPQLQQHSLRARDVRAAETADSVVVEEAVAARIQRDNLNTRYPGFLFGGVCNLRDNLYGCPVFIFLFY